MYIWFDIYTGMTALQPHHSIETADSESLSSYDRDSIHSTSTTGEYIHVHACVKITCCINVYVCIQSVCVVASCVTPAALNIIMSS